MLLLAALSVRVDAAVQVIVGATPIVDGDAKALGDITVVNEKLAFALAVESPVPYGVPRGAIIDMAPVTKGVIGRDCVVFADFIPDNWAAWPNTYQHVDILERGPEQAVIRATRDWGKATITTVYTLKAGADAIEMRTTLSNGGDAPLPELLSGMTLWPRRGFLFSVPGMSGVVQGETAAALADRVVAYDEDFFVALHAPYVDRIGDSSRDMLRLHTLMPGESRVFDAFLQVGSSGDLKAVLQSEITRKHLGSGNVHGTVTGRDGKIIAQPVVVIEEQGKAFAWVLGENGRYEVTLPAGSFTLYATARNYSDSVPVKVRVKRGAKHIRNFSDLRNPGDVQFNVTDTRGAGRPVDARISIAEGQKPLVEFLGRRTFFTELEQKGHVDVPIAPGHYVFSVSAGGGFLSPVQRVEVSVSPGQTSVSNISVTAAFDPPARHWYAADLHHHADQAEAVTPPQYLARSQLAAGLDLLFVSDHDSTVNHQILQSIAARRGIAFIPSMEISASWGHFNAYPLKIGEKLQIDTGTATVDEIFAEGRRLGAMVVQVNHPFIPYGYFTSVVNGVAPGGFNPKFDLLEVNASAPDDDVKVLHALWAYWNGGHHYYLAAGTDTHDVWNFLSGSVRTYAHLDGPVTAETFVQALKAGHGYVTAGPLIFPTVMFGDELKLKPAEPFSLGFDLSAVAGLKQVSLIERGAAVETRIFDGERPQVHADFALKTDHPTWYALIVEDRDGHKAYTDPIWADVIDFQGVTTRMAP